MKKNKFGFSFAEILVVVMILVIVSGFSISSFNKNFEEQSLYTELGNFLNIIEKQDNQIGIHTTDYEFFIGTDIGDKYYYTLNTAYKEILQGISLSGNIVTLKTNDTIKNEIETLQYFSQKLIQTYSWSSTGTFQFSVENKGNYSMVSSKDNMFLNEIFLEYYSKTDRTKNIFLSQIEVGTGNYLTGIYIKNTLGGGKKYYSSTGQILSEDIKLSFESYGTKAHLIFKNK